MFIALSPENPDPMYRQLTDQIKQAIAVGDAKPGEKLPSIRELSKALEISVITTKRAYLDLETEGYIVTRPGLGSFVAEVNRDRLRAEKLRSFGDELRRMMATGRKYGISRRDIAELLDRIEGE